MFWQIGAAEVQKWRYILLSDWLILQPLIGPQVCPALRGLWDWWWWHCDITCVCQVHDTCCHLACSGPDWGYFYDVPHSWPRGTGHLLKKSWLEFVTETKKESFLYTGFKYICGILRLCAQNTLAVLLFTCDSPKTVVFLKHVSPVLVSHR